MSFKTGHKVEFYVNHNELINNIPNRKLLLHKVIYYFFLFK